MVNYFRHKDSNFIFLGNLPFSEKQLRGDFESDCSPKKKYYFLFGGLLFLLFLQKQTNPIEYMPTNYSPLSVLIPTHFSNLYSDVSEAFCFGTHRALNFKPIYNPLNLYNSEPLNL